MNPRKRNLISAFILFHIIVIPLVPPKNYVDLNPFEKVVMPYLVWTRLLQKWRLFVPTPYKFAIKYHVDVVFKDGSTRTWRRPYPPNWGFFERHLAYNFQKWDLAAGNLERYNVLWEDLAHFIERLYWNDANPPETITLVRQTATRQPPNETGYVMHDDSELIWMESSVFRYSVSEKRIVK